MYASGLLVCTNLCTEVYACREFMPCVALTSIIVLVVVQVLGPNIARPQDLYVWIRDADLPRNNNRGLQHCSTTGAVSLDS